MKIQAENDILVPMDFSDFCAKTIHYALHHFPIEKLKVIHIAQRPLVASPGGFDAITDDTVLDDCQSAMKKFYEEHNIPTELRYVIEVGHPAEKIAAYVKHNPTEAILISSHGRTGLSRLFLGSVAEQVVRLAPCPVIVYKAEEILKDCHDNIDAIETMAKSGES